LVVAGVLLFSVNPLSSVIAQEPASTLSASAPPATGPVVTAIGVASDKGATSVTISGDGPLQYEYFVIEGKSLVIDLPGATSTVWPAEQRVDDPFVDRVRVAEQSGEKPGVRVVLDLKQLAPYRVSTRPAGLQVEFSGRPTPVAQAGREGLPGGERASFFPAEPSRVPDQPSGKRHAGARITLDFLDADITDIFRLIAEVSSMNIVATDDVKGKRSVKMTQVPWDQALELILKTNIPPLVQIPEGDNVLRITTQQRVLDDETAAEKRRLEQMQRAAAEQRQALEQAETMRRIEAETQAQALARVKTERQRSKGWRERTFTISYGDTQEIGERLKNFASGCADGCIFEVGGQSRTIFVRDFVDNVEQMTAVYQALEAPTPAVMVEARIVEVQHDYAEALGIQWGANFVADPAHGNATPFAFPNSISVGSAVREAGASPGTFLVNLPAANAVSGVGITLGHIANTFSLDMRLSALERLGKTKILSNPKVLVIQNEEANINIGSQLPVPKTDAEGNRTIEWKDVGILLQVKPNVTSDGRVFMKIKIEKSAAGETVRTTEGDMFSIERRGAETKVLVGDGETSVIGGIFQQTDSGNDDGVPGLSRLPLIGWMFRSKSQSNSRKELMIFLTPRITSPYAAQASAAPATPAEAPQAAAPLSSPARGAAAAAEGVFGTITLLKAEALSRDAVQVEVNYVNDTSFTFASSVTLNCRAYTADGTVIGAHNAHLWARELGPILPNFERWEGFSIALEGPGYAETRCTVLHAE
jgi:type IV pilus assembly protein PilQ